MSSTSPLSGEAWSARQSQRSWVRRWWLSAVHVTGDLAMRAGRNALTRDLKVALLDQQVPSSRHTDTEGSVGDGVARVWSTGFVHGHQNPRVPRSTSQHHHSLQHGLPRQGVCHPFSSHSIILTFLALKAGAWEDIERHAAPFSEMQVWRCHVKRVILQVLGRPPLQAPPLTLRSLPWTAPLTCAQVWDAALSSRGCIRWSARDLIHQSEGGGTSPSARGRGVMGCVVENSVIQVTKSPRPI